MIAGFGMVAVDKFLGGHAALAIELKFEKIESCVLTAANLEAGAVDCERGGGQGGVRRRGFGAVHLQSLALESGECAGPGAKSAHAIEKLGGGASEVHAAIFFLENGRESGFGMILRNRVQLPGFELAQGLEHEVGAERCEPGSEGFGGVFVEDGQFTLEEDVAGIKAGVDAHGGDSGDGLAAGDGPLDGGGAAILRQKRGVKI